MTVPGTPLPGLAVGGITPPWKVVPAHIVIHAGIFIGTLLTLLMHDVNTGPLKLSGGPPDGMNTAEWITWLIVGLSSGPLMASSYLMARRGGRARYLSLWVHIIANFCGEAAVIVYLYAANVVGGLLPGWAFGWSVIVSVMLLMLWLLYNDSTRLRQLETLATKLQRTDTAARDHDEDMRDAAADHRKNNL
jgi:hypothetical protein